MKTRNVLLAISLLCTFIVCIISCQKEVSFELPVTNGNDSTATEAVYTLGSSGDNCTGVELSGSYISGIAMNNTNTAKIEVAVTSPGTYSLTTEKANGIIFSASGSFTNTGAQTVVLTASGTPASDGDKKITIAGASNNCSFNITFSPPVPPAVFTLAGAPGACTTPVINGVYAAGTALSASNTVTLKVNVTMAGSYTVTTNTANGISFSGSGVFSSTGTDIPVILTGSGTPSAAGTATLTPDLSSSCSFDIVVADAPPAGSATFSCKIDGTLTTFTKDASASVKDPLTGDPYLMLGGNEEDNPESYFHIFISNNDKSAIKTGTYDEKHFVPSSPTSLGYRIEADHPVKNADLSTTLWNTSSIIPGFSDDNPPFTIIITSITATRVKGTFSGKLTNLPDNNAFKTITEGTFDLPIE